MEYVAIGLTALFAVFLAYTVYRTAKPYLLYRKAGVLKKFKGRVEGSANEEKRRIGGRELVIAYPMYSAVIGGKKRIVQGTIAYPYVRIGEAVTMLHDEEAGGLWAERDIPLLAKQLKIRIWVVGGLVAVMAVLSVFS